LDAYTDFGVTVEPAGGSPGPTGDKVLGGSF
jgi:anti-sigma-K factor RskA